MHSSQQIPPKDGFLFVTADMRTSSDLLFCVEKLLKQETDGKADYLGLQEDVESRNDATIK